MKKAYQLDNCSILPVLEMAMLSGQVHNLLVKNDKITIGEPGMVAKVQAIFGQGPNGSMTIANYLANNQTTLFEEARTYVMCKQKIADLSNLVIRLCEDAGQKPIDIAAAVFSDWMLYLPDCIKHNSVSDLVMPGTHHSYSYNVNLAEPIAQQGKEGLAVWSQILHFLPVGALVNSWELYQHESITTQLEHGARLIDLQIAYNQDNGRFYTAYNFNAGSLENIFQRIADFLKAHPGEVIFLNLNPAWEFKQITKAHYAEALDLVNTYLSPYLIGANNGINSSLADLVASNQRLLLITENIGDLISEQNQQVINAMHYSSTSLPASQVEEIRALVRADEPLANVDLLHFTADLNAGTIILHPDIEAANQKFHSNLDGLLEDYDNTANMHLMGITIDHANVNALEKIISYNIDDCCWG
ncbi:MAG: hypothetical protein JSS50_03420 [Proteobacteria bacterium]|nr:hypothetical protein [Pseudomonadota bacterium]